MQLCSLAGAISPFFFSFYIFTLSDKAPVAFSIMLCRCSQQERVIALGVWSSQRRIGGSGQSCQGSRRTPSFCVFYIYLYRTRPCVCVCVFLSRRGRNNIIPCRGVCIRAAVQRCVWRQGRRPADSDGRVPGTCQRRHTCPAAPGNLGDAAAITPQ